MGPHEPYWRTNTSFSPPPPRWDYGLPSEGNQGIQYDSNDSIQMFGSTSSNSKESRSWIRGEHRIHQSSIEGGALPYCSSPSDTSLIQPWTPPPTRSVNMDDFEASSKRGATSGPLYFTPHMEGTSMVANDGGSISSRSDSSEFDHSRMLHQSTPRNFPSRRSFMSKPIHPLSFPFRVRRLEASAPLEYDTASLLRDTHRLSTSSSSIDLADISERLEPENLSRSSNPCGPPKCGVCDRLLSQRSPWSSRRIVKSGDMPVAGVLSCSHVFHAECLEQTTPKSHKSDPPCPICVKVSRENSPEQCFFPKMRHSFPRLRAFSGEGSSSKSWGCVQIGDCVEGAHRSSMMLLNRNKIKKNLSVKGNPGKDFPGKPKRSGSHPLNFFAERFVDHGAGPSIKK